MKIRIYIISRMETMRYTLQDFTNIIFNGFEIKIPDETLGIITELALQVGSPTYIRTPIFVKKSNITNENPNNMEDLKNKKRNRNMEVVNDDDWETIRTFQTTVIEKKQGIEAQIDLVRAALNKMSDKNYIDSSTKIIDILDLLIKNDTPISEMTNIGNAIFELASNNRFFSKLYADLYCTLIDKYEIMKLIFEQNLSMFSNLFNNFEYVESEKDYNEFCRINSDNEHRKSLSAFFVNLVLNKIISIEKLMSVTCDLMKDVLILIKQDNKKNQVDEMIENIAILYNKSIFSKCETQFDGNSFIEIIKMLAKCKVKTYPSLSSKAIFKFMDLIEM